MNAMAFANTPLSDRKCPSGRRFSLYTDGWLGVMYFSCHWSLR